MPDKHPNTERWSGPGASKENAKRPPPDEIVEDPVFSKARASQVSGGGGERDVHHGRSDKAKQDRQQNSRQKQLKYD